MKYLLLINKNEANFQAMTDAAREKLVARYSAYGQKMIESGILRGGALLQPASDAATVRVRDGKRLVTDGPFAETAEQTAGLAIIECDNLEEALEWAAGHPDAEDGSVEIRPLAYWVPPESS